MTRLLTLDTCCISSLANPRMTNADDKELRALERLVELAQQSAIRLQLATAYDRDFERWDNAEGRSERLAWLEAAPVLRKRAGGLFRTDISRLDRGDVLASDEDVAVDEALRNILLPGQSCAPNDRRDSKDAAKAFSDIDHLLAHRRSKAWKFVTTDRSTILSQQRRAQLAELEIYACWPTEAVKELSTA